MGKGKGKICRGVLDGQLAERVEGVRSRHRRRAGFPGPASLKSRCLGCANRELFQRKVPHRQHCGPGDCCFTPFHPALSC